MNSFLQTRFFVVICLALCAVMSVCYGDDVKKCTDAPLKDYPMCNVSLSALDRAKDLVSRLTSDQKIMQLDTNAPEILDLGIIGYNWWSECLHGVLADGATIFPAPIGLGASFNVSGVFEMAKTISTEARAFHARGDVGLHFYAPNINIFRDPRWGRGQETPGEDPYLNGKYASQFIRGLQEGDDPRCFKTIGTCKHYAGYSLENWGGVKRYEYNAIIDDRDMAETYLPAFETCVTEGRVQSVMCSYNSVNGVPACASDFLLQTVLRDGWDFGGFVASDCDAVQCIYDWHHYTKTPEEAAAVALKAGTDSDCDHYYGDHLGAALKKGLISENDLDKAAIRLFYSRFALGMFDTSSECSYDNIPKTEVDTDAHRKQALELARETMVLLRNKDKTLPLDTSKQAKIALIGPHADDPDLLLSDYHRKPAWTPITPYAAVKLAGINVNYAQGCNVNDDDMSMIPDAVSAAKESDVIIFCLGLNTKVESEGVDRISIELPGVQPLLLGNLTQLQKEIKDKTGKHIPIVVVLFNGGGIADDWIYDNADGVLEAFYPGEYGGQAVIDTLFGKYNPGGKMPITIYKKEYIDQSDFKNMSMRVWPGRTYKYLQVEPHVSFGEGLSYTTFNVTWVDSDDTAQGDTYYHAIVKNTGSVAGDEVVLAYIKGDGKSTPFSELFGFERVHLNPGEETDVYFTLQAKRKGAWAYGSQWRSISSRTVVQIGDYEYSR